MNNIKYLLLLASCFISSSLYSTPVVEVIFPGLLGNRLFVYCVGKIIAEELGFKVYCRPIRGFPNTYQDQYNTPPNTYPTQIINGHHDININKIIQDHSLRNIRIQGFFQRYKYLKPYSHKIRNEWLKIDPELLPAQSHNDIVIHIRTRNAPRFLPFEYYKKALDRTQFDQLFICIDEPEDPFLEHFRPYKPIIKSTRSLESLMNTKTSWDEICKINMDDFFFICSFNKIVTSDSTYGWWAAFLSNATEIYAPFSPDPSCQIYGKVEEKRYHYIETNIGR